ncbi:efflux RND transporter periplasmic adaptor subunit [Veronia pacifica]|uniref:Efflux transporter periplasmic adaptor subunit n=1 Tax=Veronia pacifica TaxID=1080227 RepID=A0A1C3EQT7_9GAMM|nr:efflux RND transporter periplasmic adaptor subunit [Veronia pacifica]ODA35600.1 efflux transporter periplasmic adaptor subunit [Veronia pacifica]
MITKLFRWLLPVLILIGSFGAYSALAKNKPEPEEKKETRNEPTVSTEVISGIDHNVQITGYGELTPLEATQLSAQVSGAVTSWHPNFVVGGIVKRGEVLFSIEKANYQAAVLQAEASLASAQATLVEEKAKGKVAASQAKSLNNKQVTDLYLRKPQLLSAQANVKSAQAALKRARRDLEKCDVAAPFDALVVSRDIGVGQFISAGSRVAVLNNVETAEVQVPIAGFDNKFLPEKIEGISATVTQKGDVERVRQGTVVRDLGIVNSATRMTSVVVRVDDPYGLNSKKTPLKFGSFVEVSFNGQRLNHVFKLPQELVSDNLVWIVNKDSQLESRKVKVVRESGEFFYVQYGLEDNDALVLTVPDYPSKGMPVVVASSDDATDTKLD